MEYKGKMICSGTVGKELTEKEIAEIKKEIDNRNKCENCQNYEYCLMCGKENCLEYQKK